MGTHDPHVDAYIEKSAEFARPLLKHFRVVVHDACPDCVEEMKWSFPHFTYKGMLCSMAAFKQHCAFGFWKGELVLGAEAKRGDAMGHLGRVTALKDLPSKTTLAKWIKKAMALNDEGVKEPRRAAPRKALAAPADLIAALKKNKKARTEFDAFSPTRQRDYIEWITDAKTDETRRQRLATALVWIGEGKSRNWKYEKR